MQTLQVTTVIIKRLSTPEHFCDGSKTTFKRYANNQFCELALLTGECPISEISETRKQHDKNQIVRETTAMPIIILFAKRANYTEYFIFWQNSILLHYVQRYFILALTTTSFALVAWKSISTFGVTLCDLTFARSPWCQSANASVLLRNVNEC